MRLIDVFYVFAFSWLVSHFEMNAAWLRATFGFSPCVSRRWFLAKYQQNILVQDNDSANQRLALPNCLRNIFVQESALANPKAQNAFDV